jgi:acyl carrier protein
VPAPAAGSELFGPTRDRSTRRILATNPGSCYISALTEISQPERGGAAQQTGQSPSAETIERDIIDILKRVSRRPIEPTGTSELLADLGFDSLQVLELVGELEDHFNIAVPLNTLTHIRTVRNIASEVHRLTSAGDAPA